MQPCEEVFLAAKVPSYRIADIRVGVGDPVYAGMPLLVFDSREIDLQLEQSRLNYERNKQLYEAGAVSQSQLEQLKNALDNLEIQKENAVITSPIRGLVSSVEAVNGQLAGAAPLISVVNIDKLKLLIQLGESNIAKLKKVGEMAIRIAAASEDDYTGVITALAPRLTPGRRPTVTLEIINETGRSKAGCMGRLSW